MSQVCLSTCRNVFCCSFSHNKRRLNSLTHLTPWCWMKGYCKVFFKDIVKKNKKNTECKGRSCVIIFLLKRSLWKLCCNTFLASFINLNSVSHYLPGCTLDSISCPTLIYDQVLSSCVELRTRTKLLVLTESNWTGAITDSIWKGKLLEYKAQTVIFTLTITLVTALWFLKNSAGVA